ncbi:tyrosine-type recombinase/integrase [Elusimicrobiota bacterium]
MVFVKIPMQERNIEQRMKAIWDWKIPDAEKKALPRFIRDLSLGKVNLGYKIGEARQLKYLDMLKICLTYFRKPVIRITVKEMENFDIALSKNAIHRVDGKPLAEETKAELRRFLRTYLKWRLGEDHKKFHALTSWLDTKVRKQRTPEFLTEVEVRRLYEACQDVRSRFVIAVLFDSGARAEEFFNIRLEDVQEPSQSSNYYRIHLKEEYSKTKGRVVPLFWDKSSEAVGGYLQVRRAQGLRSNERLFDGTYDAMRFSLKRLGKKVLQQRVYPHLLRHSSATFYAPKLNRQQLCKRYGWTFSSNMPDIYINRAGVDEKDVEQKFSQTELAGLKVRVEQQEREKKVLQATVEDLHCRTAVLEKRDSLSRIFDDFLRSDPKIMKGFVRLVKSWHKKDDASLSRRGKRRTSTGRVAF